MENTSKKNPIRHGTEIISWILNIVVTERPVELLATPGVISLLIGIALLWGFIYYFKTTRYVSLPLAIISTATILLGTIFILISLVLYAIKEVNTTLIQLNERVHWMLARADYRRNKVPWSNTVACVFPINSLDTLFYDSCFF